jgi:hypothetical protein
VRVLQKVVETTARKESQVSDDGEQYPGDELAGQTAEYPREWTSEQRVAAYWWALGHRINVWTTAGWHQVQRDLQAHAGHRRRRLNHLYAVKP